MISSSLRMIDIHRNIPRPPQTQLKRKQGYGTHFKDAPPPFIEETKKDNKIENKIYEDNHVVEGFTNMGESYVRPGDCPDGYYWCKKSKQCKQCSRRIEECNRCNRYTFKLCRRDTLERKV